MSLNVVVGGQFGSEGKGKVTAYLAQSEDAACVVRCGGPNSGHTVQFGSRKVILRHIPAGFHLSTSRLLIPSGAYVDLPLFFREIEQLEIPVSRVGVSPNAGVIEPRHIEQETSLKLNERLGSTLSGTGAAVADRVLRNPDFKLAKDIPELAPLITDVAEEVTEACRKGKTVLIEGTQGFGLSLLHSPFFPKTTSRDTTASGFSSEVGFSPRLVTDVTVVFRTFPIRVSGNSGHLSRETSWEQITACSGAKAPIREFTSVTSRLRRVGEFDVSLALLALRHNLPTIKVLNHIDYVNSEDFGKTIFNDLSSRSRAFIKNLEEELRITFDIIGTGPDHDHVVDTRVKEPVAKREQVEAFA